MLQSAGLCGPQPRRAEARNSLAFESGPRRLLPENISVIVSAVQRTVQFTVARMTSPHSGVIFGGSRLKRDPAAAEDKFRTRFLFRRTAGHDPKTIRPRYRSPHNSPERTIAFGAAKILINHHSAKRSVGTYIAKIILRTT